MTAKIPQIKALATSFLMLILTGCGSTSEEISPSTDKWFLVKRSGMEISSVFQGTLTAKKNHKLSVKASYEAILNWIEEENTIVKKGDAIARFETEKLQNDIEKYQLEIDNLRKMQEIKSEEKKLLLAENDSALEEAQDKLKRAEEDYFRYYKHEGRKQKDDLTSILAYREQLFLESKEKYNEKIDAIAKTIYENEAREKKEQATLIELEKAMDIKKNSHQDATYKLRIFKKYTYPDTLKRKQNDLNRARMNYEKTSVAIKTKLVKYENEFSNQEQKIKTAEIRLQRLQNYLSMMTLIAPVDEVLVYGDPSNRHFHHSEEIEVGARIYRGRVVATIPDMSEFIVQFDLPESFHHQIKTGAKVRIQPKSLPTLKITGEVSHIPRTSSNLRRWDKSSPKIYRSTVSLDQNHPDLVSGMTVKVDILQDTLQQVIAVPVESVFEEKSEYFVYLHHSEGSPTKQIVELGKSNHQYVEIIKGLKEEESIYLFNPYRIDQ